MFSIKAQECLRACAERALPNEFVPGTTTAITFAEGSNIDSIEIQGGPGGLTQLSAITVLSDTQFTANVTTSGGSPNYNFNLASGTF